jgi:hypothetical protein
MILICLFEFNDKNEGILKMENFNYPCAFIIGDDMYNYKGDQIIISEEYFRAPNFVMDTIIGFGDENTVEGCLYVQDNICKVNKVG